jgi:hypothetical protein
MTLAVDSFWRRLRHTRLRDALRGRIDGRLDRQQPITGAHLPTEITTAISQVVKETRLWKIERVDVAEELVAHFQDGLEAGATVQQLLASFGDVDVAARLIRRAKKRGRPLTWHLWHYSWLSLAALFLVYLFAGLYMMSDRPNIKVDYLALINERALAVPEAERAWPLYREALLSMGVRGESGDSDSASVVPDTDSKPGDANWPELERFLVDHADSLANLRAAAGRSNLGFVTSNSLVAFSPEDRDLFGVSVTNEQVESFRSQTLEDRWLISTLIPEVKQLKTAASLLASDARRAALSGDAETAMANIVALLGVSHHTQEKPFMVNLMVASAVRNMACVTIQDTFQENPQLWSDSQLRDLAHSLAATQIDWRRGFDGETASFHDVMQRFYTDDGHGDGRLAFRSSSQQNIFAQLDSITNSGSESDSLFAADSLAMLALPAANIVVASRKEMTETYLGFINTAVMKIDMPLVKQNDVPLPNEELLSDRAGLMGQFRYLFVRLMVPAYQMLWNKIANSEGQRDGVLVGLALELYHREHDAWPKTLAELSPRWLPDVPVDRITGDSLGYKIVDDRPVIYSIGVDRDDDAGRVPQRDMGNPDVDLASPNHFQSHPVDKTEHDGDWVIWSMAGRDASQPGKNMTKQSRERD